MTFWVIPSRQDQFHMESSHLICHLICHLIGFYVRLARFAERLASFSRKYLVYVYVSFSSISVKHFEQIFSPKTPVTFRYPLIITFSFFFHSNFLFIYLSIIYLFICLFIYLFILFIYIFIYLFILRSRELGRSRLMS